MLSKIEEILWVKIIIRAVIAALLTFVIILSWEVYLEHIVDAWKGSPFSESFNYSPVSYLHGTEIIIETTVTAFLVILLYSASISLSLLLSSCPITTSKMSYNTILSLLWDTYKHL